MRLMHSQATGVARTCSLALGANQATVAKVCTMSNSVGLGTAGFNVMAGRCLKVKNSWNPFGGESGLRLETIRTFKLRDKWMEYQGIKNWDGLLDPLDDGLRSEILRYGMFVEAAYRSFEFDTSSEDYATCKYSKESMLTACGIGDTGYKVTKHLRATCGAQLPRWTERMPSWVSASSSWIGYVAVCTDQKEIDRLGRRDIVIALRGTATCMEWLENLRATLTFLPSDEASKPEGPMVESGFLSMYTSANATCQSLQDMIREEIARIMEMYGGEPLSVTITGHSLGAALATLTAYDLTTRFDDAPLVTVVSFGGPRVGNQSFRCQLEKSGTKILRIVNSDDLITKVPGFVIDSNDMADKGPIHLALLPSWLQKRVEDTQWVYADVGKELRLCSKESPYIRKGDIATCHDLKTYLHLVDGFVSSKCPFRATAKKLLSRGPQMEEQLLASI